MEDFFEILIYIFIIISVISSFFKKKKTQQKQPLRGSQISNDVQTHLPVQNVKPEVNEEPGVDIFKDLEKFFQVGEAEEKIPKKHNDKDIYEGAEERAEYKVVPEESFHQKTSSEHTFVDPWEKKRTELERKISKVNESIEEKASKFEEYLQKEETAATEISKQIRLRFKNPATLKDYIIISEIMGKPKSLSRRKYF